MRILVFILFSMSLLTSCSRTFWVTRDDPYYELRIKHMNLIGSQHECNVGFNSGCNIVTSYLSIDYNSMSYVEKGSTDTLSVPFRNVTSIYYFDRRDGFIQGALIGGAIGFPVGYVLLQDWTDFGGATHHSPETGGCCLGAVGTIAGAIPGAINGTQKTYTLKEDGSAQKDTLIIWKNE